MCKMTDYCIEVNLFSFVTTPYISDMSTLADNDNATENAKQG